MEIIDYELEYCADKTKKAQNPLLQENFGLEINGAGGRNRTDMDIHPLDFESSASTSFTTPAHMNG